VAGHKASQCASNSDSGKCTNCGKPGHVFKDCWSKGGGSEKSRDKANLSKVKEFSFASSHINSPPSDVNVIIDSGCTSYMFNDTRFFATLDTDCDIEVKNANSSSSAVRGKGDAVLKVRDSAGNVCVLTFPDALYVPEYSHCLLSVKRIQDKGHTVQFKDPCSITCPDGTQIPVSEQSNMFVLPAWFPSGEMGLSSATSGKVSLDIWHKRLGHNNVVDTVKAVKGKDIPHSNQQSPCDVCATQKAKRLSISKTTSRKTCGAYDLVVTDVFGPLESSVGQHRYAITFIDVHTRYAYIYFMPLKSDALEMTRQFIVDVRKPATLLSELDVTTLRSDNGGEYTSESYKEFCSKNQIKREYTAPYTPEWNGIAERYWQTINDMSKCLRATAGLPPTFWVRSMDTAVYIRNRCITKPLGISPHEALFGTPPDIDHLKTFGCTAYLYVEKNLRTKLMPKAEKAIFMGYGQSDTYILYKPGTRRFVVSRNVTFDESDFPYGSGVSGSKVSGSDAESSSEDGQDEPTEATDDRPVESPTCATESYSEDEGQRPQTLPVAQDVQPPAEATRPERRSVRERRRPAWLRDYATLEDDDREEFPECFLTESSDDTPSTYQEAIECQDSRKWYEAMNREYESLMKNKTWRLVELPKGRKAVSGRWLYKIKYNNDGTVDKYKARFVAKGFSQRYGVDYEETFAPTTRMATIRIVLSLAVQEGTTVNHLDVKGAYLHSTLEEEIYLKQPEGYEKSNHHGNPYVCRLQKGIYGLRQAGRRWYETLDAFLVKTGFKRSSHDPCLYVLNGMILVVWVDDIILTGLKEAVRAFKSSLCAEFDIDDRGPLKWFLGFEVGYDGESLTINQTSFVKDVLTRFNMADCNGVKLLMTSNYHESSAESPLLSEDQQATYRQLTGSLIHLSNVSRPDLSFAVSYLSGFLGKATDSHWIQAKHVLRYLKHTSGLALTFRKVADFVLVGYSDASWASDLDSRRSITGYCFRLGDKDQGMISWNSRKQPTVALSSTEAEYLAVSSAAQECIFLRGVLSDVGVAITGATVIYEDNMGCIALAENPVLHKRTKHIDTRHHFIRDLIKEGVIKLEYKGTDAMIADILTKNLAKAKLDDFRAELLGTS
jgi:hypothetical protein